MKNKRGTDHKWEIVKFTGDIVLYAKCKCGFNYCCSTSGRDENGYWTPTKQIIDPHKIYPYCPLCGARKKYYIDDIKKIDRFRWE